MHETEWIKILEIVHNHYSMFNYIIFLHKFDVKVILKVELRI